MSERNSVENQFRLSEIPINSPENDDDHEWADRSEYWIAELNKRKRGGPKRVDHQPLILAGHGVRLNIENGTLLIRNGRTHHPQQIEQWRFFRGDRFLPSRIVMLDGDGYLTFDVLAWLSEQDVPLIQIDWMGSVVTMGGATGYSADRKLVEAQLAAKRNGTSLEIAIWLIEQKLRAAAETLRQALPRGGATVKAIDFIDGAIRKLKSQPPKSISSLNGIEGRAAYLYFAAWREIPLKWKGVGRKPIPSEWLRVGSRVSLNETNRHAIHPVNAMLNYSYAVLENLVRVQIVAAGLDPVIGYLHGNHHEKHPLALDLMEPLRPTVDRAVLDFAQAHTFTPGDFTLTADGVCRLSPQLARNIAKAVDLSVAARQLVMVFQRRLATAA